MILLSEKPMLNMQHTSTLLTFEFHTVLIIYDWFGSFATPETFSGMVILPVLALPIRGYGMGDFPIAPRAFQREVLHREPIKDLAEANTPTYVPMHL